MLEIKSTNTSEKTCVPHLFYLQSAYQLPDAPPQNPEMKCSHRRRALIEFAPRS